MQRLIEFCRRHLLVVLGALVLFTGGTGVLASQLQLDSNLTRLLPRRARSVQGLDRLEESYGGQIGQLIVVLQGRDRAALEKAADKLAPKLARVADVRRVEYKKPVDFFRRYRLLYADKKDLQEAHRRLKKSIVAAKKKANPLFVSLDDSKSPPKVDFSDLTSKYGDKFGGLDQSPYFVNKDGTKLALFLYPDFPARNLARAQAFSKRVTRVLDQTLPAATSKVHYGLSGRYQKRVELQSTLQKDLTLATGVAGVLLLAFLLVFLRSFCGMLVVVLPLVAGTIWTFAWAYLTFGTLNVLTGFLGAVLMGIGVDYGIHLYVRYHQLRDRYDGPRALAETFKTSGRANFYGGLTTAIALGSLIVSDFRAFFEFGTIALGGVALVLLAYTLLLPPLILLVERYGGRFSEPASLHWTRKLCGRLHGGPRCKTVARAGKWAGAAIIGIMAVTALGIPKLGFDRSFDALELRQGAAWKLGEMVDRTLGHSQTPAVVLTKSPAHSQQVIDEIERRKRETPGGKTIDKAVSLNSLLPSQQRAKLAVLADIRHQLDEIPKSDRTKKQKAYLAEVRHVVEHGPLTVADLPQAIHEPFARKSGGDVVLVFPATDLENIDSVTSYVDALRDLPGVGDPNAKKPTSYDAISEVSLLYDIVHYVKRDAIWMLVITLLGLLFASLAAFGRRREILIQMGILLVGFVGALGMAGWVGVNLNFLNIVILPIWLGLGVDASYHVLLHLREDPHDYPAHVTTSLAIGAAFLTTAIGFGAMMLAHHAGLASLGEIAVVGLAVILLVNWCGQVLLVGRATRK